ncbi:vWA domain-containing protein [Solicola gregarius]|uniref:VWA domain-containing protein n=1 Tax=Solicola gregarius TaxID=2908642 RepID=A0AA46YLB9_9ACTN|nr:VWA domain-containing protein [Solicola gregarius]UYM06765.1 VWA domain-containing protein [Solicola gregarius]
MSDADEVFAGFARAVAAAGVSVTPDRTQTYLEAVSRAGADDRAASYWAGRATLCSTPDDFAAYDATFETWFSAEPPTLRDKRRTESRSVPQADLSSADAEGDGDSHNLSVVASAEEVLRNRDVADLPPAERTLLNRMFARLEPHPPTRRSPRRRHSRRGEIDPARTVRDQLRRAGEPGPLRYRRRRVRERRTVWLIDVSGSMEPYADSLLRLAHRAVTAAPRTTEVFTLGTRLTRVTPALRLRDPELALTTAGSVVPDWSGGTRLGEVLRAFVDRWGQRGMARSAVVVVCSDGWERGDPVLLGQQVERLSRLTYRLVWANPHRGKVGYEPVQGGIAAVLPYVDALVAGHSMRTFGELLAVVAAPAP